MHVISNVFISIVEVLVWHGTTVSTLITQLGGSLLSQVIVLQWSVSEFPIHRAAMELCFASVVDEALAAFVAFETEAFVCSRPIEVTLKPFFALTSLAHFSVDDVTIDGVTEWQKGTRLVPWEVAANRKRFSCSKKRLKIFLELVKICLRVKVKFWAADLAQRLSTSLWSRGHGVNSRVVLGFVLITV